MTGIIILAAGASTRMGKAKQQLLYQGKTFLQHAIGTALASQAESVVVVLGANESAILPQVDQSSVTLVQNYDWQEGMASSIRMGIGALKKLLPDAAHAVIMLCDQPLVTSGLLNRLVQAKTQSGKGIIACAYQDTLGAPVLFDNRFFPELLQLTGQEGAKKLIIKHHAYVFPIPFPAAGVDIDTPEDYLNFIKAEKED